MRTYEAYCSACDHPVTVAPLSEFPEAEWPDGADARGVVCLEMGASCTGELCPLFEVPTETMLARYRAAMETGGAGPGGDHAD